MTRLARVFAATSGIVIGGIAACGAAGCGPMRSMVPLSSVVAPPPRGFAARFVADAQTLAVHFEQPGLGDLVLYDPEVGAEGVVLVAGVVSGGGAGPVTLCFDLRGAPADWREHVRYREQDGALSAVPIESVEHLSVCP